MIRKSLLLFLILNLMTSCIKIDQNSKLLSTSGNERLMDNSLSVFLISGESQGDLNGNSVTKRIEEELGIDLDITSSLKEDVFVRKSMMFYSKNYPQAFLSGEFSSEEVMQYGVNEEILLPLNQLVLTQTTFLKNNYYTPGLLPYIMTPNGVIYALPAINEDRADKHRLMLFINQKWLEELNLNPPENTEQLYSVLKAFREEDPNGNGKQDEIPLTGSNNSYENNPVHFIMNAFIYDDGWSYFFRNENRIEFAPVQSEWREGLRYMKKLYAEGLLDTNMFYQSSYHLKLNIKNDRELVYGAIADSKPEGSLFIDDSLIRHTFFTALPPLEGPRGMKTSPCYNPVDYHYDFALTNRCRTPEKGILLAEYLASPEGTFLTVFGEEGVSWERPDPSEGLTDLSGAKAEFNLLNPTLDRLWGKDHFLHLTSPMVENWAVSEDSMGQEGYYGRVMEDMEKYDEFCAEYSIRPAFIKSSLSREILWMREDLIDYVDKSMINFITGHLDIEEDWDVYIDRLIQLGLEKYVQTYQTYYGENESR